MLLEPASPSAPLTDVHAASQGQGGLAQGHTQRERLKNELRPNASAAPVLEFLFAGFRESER